jgi:hypothetical protein
VDSDWISLLHLFHENRISGDELSQSNYGGHTNNRRRGRQPHD